MGSMKYEEYMTKFLELLKYVPYLKYEKEKFQRFISGFPLEFKVGLSMMSLDHRRKSLGS